MWPKKADSTKAYGDLKRNAILFGSVVLIARLAPYALHFITKSKSA
jgi:hypothetical protein